MFGILLLFSFWTYKPWSQVWSFPSPPPVIAFIDFGAFGSAPTNRQFFIECCLLTLSRFPQVI